MFFLTRLSLRGKGTALRVIKLWNLVSGADMASAFQVLSSSLKSPHSSRKLHGQREAFRGRPFFSSIPKTDSYSTEQSYSEAWEALYSELNLHIWEYGSFLTKKIKRVITFIKYY